MTTLTRRRLERLEQQRQAREQAALEAAAAFERWAAHQTDRSHPVAHAPDQESWAIVWQHRCPACARLGGLAGMPSLEAAHPCYRVLAAELDVSAAVLIEEAEQAQAQFRAWDAAGRPPCGCH